MLIKDVECNGERSNQFAHAVKLALAFRQYVVFNPARSELTIWDGARKITLYKIQVNEAELN